MGVPPIRKARATRELTLEVTDLSRAGAGVARTESGQVVFVPFAAPGDRVRARVTDTDARYASAEILEVLHPSPNRVEPRCAVFGRCGGCQWQHLPYELQWATKLAGVEFALKRSGLALPEGGIEGFPAPDPWEYRNRVQLRGNGSELGFYREGTRERVPIERCEIARPELNVALAAARSEGASSRAGGEYKLELEVVGEGNRARVMSHWNQPHAAGGFRQVNDAQNARLRAWIADHLPAADTLMDLYGGSGNLSLGLAGRYREIHCVDVGAPSERPRGTPAHVHFARSAVGPWVERRAADGRGWVAILDPPREGLRAEFAAIADGLERLGVRHAVAVGCDPDAWVGDVGRFARRGWRLARGAVFDFFPQTPHVESVALLERA